MSGECGPIAMSRLAGSIAEANGLLTRAIGALQADLASHIEVVAVLQSVGDDHVPDLSSIDEGDLDQVGWLISLIIDIEDHLQLPEDFYLEASPAWLRVIIQHGRAQRERAS